LESTELLADGIATDFEEQSFVIIGKLGI